MPSVFARLAQLETQLGVQGAKVAKLEAQVESVLNGVHIPILLAVLAKSVYKKIVPGQSAKLTHKFISQESRKCELENNADINFGRLGLKYAEVGPGPSHPSNALSS
jgi:hypothetical protein